MIRRSLLLLALLASCKRPSPPTDDPAPVVTCRETPASAARPAILTDDTTLEWTRHDGLFAVAYAPCGAIEIVPECTIPGKYTFHGGPSGDTLRFEDEGAAANGVFGAGPLLAKEKGAKLALQTMVVSHVVAEPEAEAAAALDTPACAKATHVVVAGDNGGMRIARTDGAVLRERGPMVLTLQALGGPRGDTGPKPVVVGLELVQRRDAAKRFAELDALAKAAHAKQAEGSHGSSASKAIDVDPSQLGALGDLLNDRDAGKTAAPRPTGSAKVSGKPPQADILAPPQ